MLTHLILQSKVHAMLFEQVKEVGVKICAEILPLLFRRDGHARSRLKANAEALKEGNNPRVIKRSTSLKRNTESTDKGMKAPAESSLLTAH